MSTPRLLEIKDLRVEFKVYGGVLKVLDGVNFSVNAGEKVGLVGETGCGKTTTMKAVLRILPVPPAQVQEAVSLIADLSGPAPESASWEPSPDNIFDANTLFFENHDSGDPTRILATMVTASFPTIYELSFTITAVYSNGGSLSEEVVVTVMGGP